MYLASVFLEHIPDRTYLSPNLTCLQISRTNVCVLRADPDLPRSIWSHVSFLANYHVHSENFLAELYTNFPEVGKNKPQLVTDRRNLTGTPVKICMQLCLTILVVDVVTKCVAVETDTHIATTATARIV